MNDQVREVLKDLWSPHYEKWQNMIDCFSDDITDAIDESDGSIRNINDDEKRIASRYTLLRGRLSVIHPLKQEHVEMNAKALAERVGVSPNIPRRRRPSRSRSTSRSSRSRSSRSRSPRSRSPSRLRSRS